MSERLGTAGVAEVGFVATTLAWIQLAMGGPLTHREDGSHVPYAERVEGTRVLQSEVIASLKIAAAREARRVASFKPIAEAAIRAGAKAGLLAAPGIRSRSEWLTEMARRMASHSSSAPLIARLALSGPKDEMLAVLDQTFRDVFAV